MYRLIILFLFLVPQAHAFLVPPSQLPYIAAGGASTSTVVGVGAASLAVGTAIGYFGFQALFGGLVKDSDIVIQTNNKKPLPVPSGWSQGTSTSPQPVPPSTTSQVQSYSTNICGVTRSDSSLAGACARAASAATAAGACGTSSPGVNAKATATAGPLVNGQPTCTVTVGTNPSYSVFANGGVGCPTGYSLQSGACVLSVAGNVEKPDDGKLPIVRTGDSFAADPRHPARDGVPETLQITPSAVTYTAPDGSGKTTVSALAGGATQVVTETYNSNTGQTTRKTATVGAPDANGESVVTGFKEELLTGTGAQATTQTSTAELGKETTLQDIKARQCGGAGQPACNVKVDETGTPTDSQITTEREGVDAALEDKKTKTEEFATVRSLSSLPFGLVINWPNASCQNPSVGVKGHTLTVDICSHQSGVSGFMNWVCAIFTAIGIFHIAASAVKGD